MQPCIWVLFWNLKDSVFLFCQFDPVFIRYFRFWVENMWKIFGRAGDHSPPQEPADASDSVGRAAAIRARLSPSWVKSAARMVSSSVLRPRAIAVDSIPTTTGSPSLHDMRSPPTQYMRENRALCRSAFLPEKGFVCRQTSLLGIECFFAFRF